MTQTTRDCMINGMDSFAKRIEHKKRVYSSALEHATNERNGSAFTRIKNRDLFNDVLEHFGVMLRNESAVHDLSSIYEVGIHLPSGALLIANKGATLFCLSPKTETPYITRHIGCCVYLPGMGVEVANIGLSGNVYEGPVVLRSESACTPSFLFGSQRCNCAHQWDTIRELAAHYNKIKPPSLECGREFEKWVQQQFKYEQGRHIPVKPGQGIITVHVDTQNGMGSGYSNDEFSFDLFSRASLRHRGEYSAEQIHQTSMAGGFRAIGIRPDPRGANDECGYKITAVVLDWLHVSRDLIFLTNNKQKIGQLQKSGYRVNRIKSLGTVNAAGAQEAEERGVEFDHMDIDCTPVSFAAEMQRLKQEISRVVKDKACQVSPIVSKCSSITA